MSLPVLEVSTVATTPHELVRRVAQSVERQVTFMLTYPENDRMFAHFPVELGVASHELFEPLITTTGLRNGRLFVLEVDAEPNKTEVSTDLRIIIPD